MARLRLIVCLALLGLFVVATSRMIGAGVAPGEAVFAAAFMCVSGGLFAALTWAAVRVAVPSADRAGPGAAPDRRGE